MPLTEEYIKELFASDAFKNAVGEYLKENLEVSVAVGNGRGMYGGNNDVEVRVKLGLRSDKHTWEVSTFSESFDSVTVG